MEPKKYSIKLALSCTWTQRSEVLSWIGANTYAEATEARNSDPKFALKLDLNSALKLLSSVELSKGKYNSLASIFVYEEESPACETIPIITRRRRAAFKSSNKLSRTPILHESLDSSPTASKDSTIASPLAPLRFKPFVPHMPDESTSMKDKRRPPNVSTVSALTQLSAPLSHSDTSSSQNRSLLSPNFNSPTSFSSKPKHSSEPKPKLTSRKPSSNLRPSMPSIDTSGDSIDVKTPSKYLTRSAASLPRPATNTHRESSSLPINTRLTLPTSIEPDLKEESTRLTKKRQRRLSTDMLEYLALLPEKKRTRTAAIVLTRDEPTPEVFESEEEKSTQPLPFEHLSDYGPYPYYPSLVLERSSTPTLPISPKPIDESWCDEWETDPTTTEFFDCRDRPLDMSHLEADATYQIISKPPPLGHWMDDTWLTTSTVDSLFS